MADKLTTFMCHCLEIWETQPPGLLYLYLYLLQMSRIKSPFSEAYYICSAADYYFGHYPLRWLFSNVAFRILNLLPSSAIVSSQLGPLRKTELDHWMEASEEEHDDNRSVAAKGACCFGLFEVWGPRFELRSWHGHISTCLCVVLLCASSDLAMGESLIQRILALHPRQPTPCS